MTGATVLIIGGGGREHALAWCFARADSVAEVLVAPGNAGTAMETGCRNIDVDTGDVAALVELAHSNAVDLVVVGPEGPLVAGVVDALTDAAIPAFGPRAGAARLEGSKAFCKEFLMRHGIPTAWASTHSDLESAIEGLKKFAEPPVVKASGLAAGKGVIVAQTFGEAENAIRWMLVDSKFGSAGSELLLEERLRGTEVSVLAFCDGKRWSLMPAAQDHKRLLADDIGPNTGGMGAFVPSPVADHNLISRVKREIIQPTLAGMAAEANPYRGVLYVGVMVTPDGPKVIEFNCRFGDPETQVVLPLLRSDPLELFVACAAGSLDGIRPEWSADAAVTVVMASEGYPVSSAPSASISGLQQARDVGCTVFHAGTRIDDGGDVKTSGGRVLAVTAVDSELAVAAHKAHEGVALINFDGAQHRADIALATAKVRP